MKEPINDVTRLIGRCNGMIHDADRDIHRSREREAAMEKTFSLVNTVGGVCAVLTCLVAVVPMPPRVVSQDVVAVACFIVSVAWYVSGHVMLARIRRAPCAFPRHAHATGGRHGDRPHRGHAPAQPCRVPRGGDRRHAVGGPMRLGPFIPPGMPPHWARVERRRWAARTAAGATPLLVLAFCVAHAVWGPQVRPWYLGCGALWAAFVWRLDRSHAADAGRAMLLDAMRRR